MNIKLKTGLFLLLTGLFFNLLCSDKSDVAKPKTSEEGVTKMKWNGWDNSYQITNATTKIIVVPAIGRIMYYGLKEGSNVLWNDPQLYGKTLPTDLQSIKTWSNFGGDKVWPTPQDDFGKINGMTWPPDPWFDGAPHTVKELEDGVEITSPVSDFCGAQSIREIRLDKESSRLTINQRIKKLKKAQIRSVEPIRHIIWNVTQIISPSQALFNLNSNSKFQQGYYIFPTGGADNFTVEGNTGIFVPHASNAQKAGADSDKWLAAIFDNVVIGEFFTFDPAGSYPDNGCSAEVYTSSDYTEIELLSPMQYLDINQEISFTIEWELYQLPDNAKSAADKRKAAVEWLNSK